MAYQSYLPRRDAELVTWSANFATKISAAPLTYGLTTSQAANYADFRDIFVQVYQTASSPATRSPTNIIIKDEKRSELVANTRQLVGIVQKYPGTTDPMRSELGINIPKQREPVPVPAVSPSIDLLRILGHEADIVLHTGVLSSIAKPDGVKGASVFYAVGETAPVNVNEWVFVMNTQKNKETVTFDLALTPGTKVWITAFWYNTRSQSGPAADPISTVINYGQPVMMSQQSLSKAA